MAPGSLALGAIIAAIRQTPMVGRVAVQRARANCSDPRPSMMRGEIDAPGTDPIEPFGLAKDPRRNAADLEGVIDALEPAIMRPSPQVFVIVRGDGGSGALAAKAHEHGKHLVGRACRWTHGPALQAVCAGARRRR